MRKWFRSFYSSGLFIPFILLLPYMCTIALNGADKALLLHSPGVEDMVPLMLMVQMKGDYAEEAVKAQAVIARSEVYRRLEEGESEGEILDEVSESIAGKNRERRVEQMTAVTEDEEVLSFRIAELNSGRSFVVGYGGVWKLLSAVDKLQQYGAAAEATVGQVLTYNGNWLEGETFRQGMHLASADFSVQKVGKMVRFLCKGKGHGIGFSQYGGNEMAKKGSSWEEILETYFPEMEVEAVMEMER
mgnify:CR=1 FL=1